MAADLIFPQVVVHRTFVFELRGEFRHPGRQLIELVLGLALLLGQRRHLRLHLFGLLDRSSERCEQTQLLTELLTLRAQIGFYLELIELKSSSIEEPKSNSSYPSQFNTSVTFSLLARQQSVKSNANRNRWSDQL